MLIYAFFHSLVHIALVVLVAIIFGLTPFTIIIAFLATAIVDLDHFQLWLKEGIRGYLFLRTITEFGKPRSYAFHKFYVLIPAAICSIFLSHHFLFLSIACTSITFHLLWDLLEDVGIFKMGIMHWL